MSLPAWDNKVAANIHCCWHSILQYLPELSCWPSGSIEVITPIGVVQMDKNVLWFWCRLVVISMFFHDIIPFRILEAQLLEVVGIVHTHVIGLILHHRHSPAFELKKVILHLIITSRCNDSHCLSIKLPWFLLVHIESADSHGTITGTAHNSIRMFRRNLAFSREGVIFIELGNEAIGIASQSSIHIPEDSSHLTTTDGALRGIEPSATFISHGANGLKTTFKSCGIMQIDGRHTRDIEVLIVLCRSNAPTHSWRSRGRIDVSHQIQVVIEWRSMQTIGQMVHEVTGTTFNESMIIMEDIAGSIVKHSGATPEGCEGEEIVQSGWCMWRLQVPTKARGMCRIIEESHVRLRPSSTGNQAHTPATMTVGRHVGTVPGIGMGHVETQGVRHLADTYNIHQYPCTYSICRPKLAQYSVMLCKFSGLMTWPFAIQRVVLQSSKKGRVSYAYAAYAFFSFGCANRTAALRKSYTYKAYWNWSGVWP